MPNIEVNGTRLEYAEQGTGQPIVFVHGVLNDLRSWKDQIEGSARPAGLSSVGTTSRAYRVLPRPSWAAKLLRT